MKVIRLKKWHYNVIMVIATVGILASGFGCSDGNTADPPAPPEETFLLPGSPTTVEKEIDGGYGPWGIAASSDSQYVYVANAKGGEVTVIETADNSKVGSEILIGNGSHAHPMDVAVSPDDEYVYTTDYEGGKVAVIKASTIGLAQREVTYVDIEPNSGAVSLAVTPFEEEGGEKYNYIYVANFVKHYVSIIKRTVIENEEDTHEAVMDSDDQLLKIEVGTNPRAVVSYISTEQGKKYGKYVFVAVQQKNVDTKTDYVAVIDVETNEIVENIDVGNSPQALAVSEFYVFVANYIDDVEGNKDSVTVIELDTLTVKRFGENEDAADRLVVGNRPIGMMVYPSSDAGEYLYVTNEYNKSISIITLTEPMEVLGEVPLSDTTFPKELVSLDIGGKEYVYVTSYKGTAENAEETGTGFIAIITQN